jgi:hypothetical protein
VTACLGIAVEKNATIRFHRKDILIRGVYFGKKLILERENTICTSFLPLKHFFIPSQRSFIPRPQVFGKKYN